jgi:hypothetical protein
MSHMRNLIVHSLRLDFELNFLLGRTLDSDIATAVLGKLILFAHEQFPRFCQH